MFPRAIYLPYFFGAEKTMYGGRPMNRAYQTIIDAEKLARHVDAPGWRIIDCRFDLMNKEAGQQRYAEAHIPNALYAHLEDDLSGPQSAGTGRHPLPSADLLADRFSSWGIDGQTQIVAYDGQSGALASRLWWLSRWLGHDRVAVLSGGFAAWQSAGFSTNARLPEITATRFSARVDDSLWISTRDLQTQLDKGKALLVDAREEARFRGEVEPLDKIAGHIPGSVNSPFEWNLDVDGKFLTPEKLQAHLSQILTNFTEKKIIHSCGSGVTACHNILAMEIIGLSGSLLYPGSWSAWITDPKRPVSGLKES